MYTCNFCLGGDEPFFVPLLKYLCARLISLYPWWSICVCAQWSLLNVASFCIIHIRNDRCCSVGGLTMPHIPIELVHSSKELCMSTWSSLLPFFVKWLSLQMLLLLAGASHEWSWEENLISLIKVLPYTAAVASSLREKRDLKCTLHRVFCGFCVYCSPWKIMIIFHFCHDVVAGSVLLLFLL